MDGIMVRVGEFATFLAHTTVARHKLHTDGAAFRTRERMNTARLLHSRSNARALLALDNFTDTTKG